MKKLILLTAAALMLSMYSNAQGTSLDTREQFKLGIKLGGNFANVYDAHGEKFQADGKLGFAGGGFMSIPAGKFLGVQPEIMFSQKGFKATGTFLGSNFGLTRTKNFLDIPLLAAIKPSETVSIFIGPQFSFLINQTDRHKSTNFTIEQTQEFENDNIRKSLLGLTTGVDVNIQQFVISTRLGWDLLENREDGDRATPRYKNTWVQLAAGYRFL